MSHEFELEQQALRGPWTADSAARCSRWALFAVLIGCFLNLQPAVAAEEVSLLLAYSPIASLTHEPLREFALSPSLHTSSSAPDSDQETPRFATHLTFALDEEPSILEESRFDRVLRTEPQASGLLAGRSLVLFQTRIATRYCYDGCAKLRSGYGQVFAGRDTLGRSRINGAGVTDTDYFYLKLSFSF